MNLLPKWAQKKAPVTKVAPTEITSQKALNATPSLAQIVRGRLDFWLSGRNIQVLPADIGTYIAAYTENDIIFSVQDWKSSKVAAAPPILYKIKNENAFKQYKELSQKNDIKSQLEAYKQKGLALEPVDSHRILTIFKKPNPTQTRFQFLYAVQTMLDIVGTTFISGNRLTGGVNKGQIMELWRLPEQGMQVEGMGIMSPPTQYRAPGVKQPIPAENVLMLKRFNPAAEMTLQYHWGLSRLEPLRKAVLTKYEALNEAETEITQNRGQRDLVFPKGVNLADADMEAAKEAYDQMNSKLQSKSRAVGSAMELGGIKVGSSPVDMGFRESDDGMWEKTCANYHVSKMIFSSTKDASYNNITEARKYSITDGVLPDQALLYDYLNDFFVSSFNTETEKYYMEPDLDYYPELQEDQNKKAEYLSKLPLKPNQMLEAFRYEADPHEFMNVPMMPTGHTPITDFERTEVEPGEEEEDDGTYSQQGK